MHDNKSIQTFTSLLELHTRTSWPSTSSPSTWPSAVNPSLCLKSSFTPSSVTTNPSGMHHNQKLIQIKVGFWYAFYVLMYFYAFVVVVTFSLRWCNTAFWPLHCRFADAGLMLIFYSLYYGCLNRDFAEIATNRMASTIGVSVVTAQTYTIVLIQCCCCYIIFYFAVMMTYVPEHHLQLQVHVNQCTFF